MAESQLRCMDDEHVNEKIPESRPEFYYSEEQRAALEQLLRSGDGAFKTRLKEDNIRDFLSAKEVRLVRKSFQEYSPDGDPESGPGAKSKDSSSADSGVHSTYWPQMSDTEVPPLDIGWSGSSGVYKGVTRVSVYTHPPKESGPHIKQVVRRLIQEAQKVNRLKKKQTTGSTGATLSPPAFFFFKSHAWFYRGVPIRTCFLNSLLGLGLGDLTFNLFNMNLFLF